MSIGKCQFNIESKKREELEKYRQLQDTVFTLIHKKI